MVRPSATDTDRDAGITWNGEQLESTPRELYDTQGDGENVVVEANGTTGVYVSAIRRGERLCITLNPEGENVVEDWCDTPAVRTPDELEGVAGVRSQALQTAAGEAATFAFGWTRPEVASVEIVGQTTVAVQHNLPFWAYGFFSISLGAPSQELRFVDASGQELERRTVTSAT